MKVFISWSGHQSRQIAEALRDWLPMVVQAAEVYMSARDNEAGVRWNAVVSAELDSTDFGILCLTPENLEAPWILFEAGALGKAVDRARVVPLLYNLTPTDVLAPLNQFMMQTATREGVGGIVTSLNNTSDAPIAPDIINGTFDALWPRLEEAMQAVHQQTEVQHAERSERDLLEEILEIVRSEQRTGNILSFVETGAAATREDVRRKWAAGTYRPSGKGAEDPRNIPDQMRRMVELFAPGEYLTCDVIGKTVHLLYAAKPDDDAFHELEESLDLFGYDLRVISQT